MLDKFPTNIIVYFGIFFNPLFARFAQVAIFLREWQQNLFFRQNTTLPLVQFYTSLMRTLSYLRSYVRPDR